MARKGKRRSIQVFGCTLTDGTQLNHTDLEYVSVIVNPDKTVTVTDVHNNERLLTDDNGTNVEWVSYVPRTN